jgi:hypothetical protein
MRTYRNAAALTDSESDRPTRKDGAVNKPREDKQMANLTADQDAMANARELVASHQYTGGWTFNPYHEACDRAKFDELVKSMTANGWQGAPIVNLGGQLITGSHRFAACQEVGLNPLVVDILDIIDVEFDDLMGEYGLGSAEEALEDLPMFCELLRTERPELASYLGIDIH